MVKETFKTPQKPKPQIKIEGYERIIDSYNKESVFDDLIVHLKSKHSKDVSLNSICDYRTELFNLMLYVEKNDRRNNDLIKDICKLSENLVIDGSVKYRFE